MGTISPLDDNLTIGNYEIIEKLGGWSSGSVYRGLDPELGRADRKSTRLNSSH